MFAVLSSVYLYDQPPFQAYEIYNVRAQGLLSAKLVVSELTETKLLPEGTFSVGRIVSQLPGFGSVHPPILTFPRKGGRNEKCTLLQPCLAQGGKLTLQHRRIFKREKRPYRFDRELRIDPQHFRRLGLSLFLPPELCVANRKTPVNR